MRRSVVGSGSPGSAVNDARSRHWVGLLGLRVRVAGVEQLVSELMAWTETPAQTRVAVGVNAHLCNLAACDTQFRHLVQECDLAYADGQSVVWASRMFGNAIPERAATTDLVFPLTRAAAMAGRRVFLYGSVPGVAERAAARLRRLEPALQVAVSDGYVPPEEMTNLVRRINEFGTDILFVGLGDPMQQQWVARHRDALRVPVVLTCGGLLDWTSGENRRPPHWMISTGLEWLWRLRLEPRRLARRYLLGNPAFMARILRQFVQERLL